MDRMLVAVFDSRRHAVEGENTLLHLAHEGSIGLYAYAILTKDANGNVSVRQGDDSGSMGAFIGTAFGGLVGVMGGPVGIALGAAAGLTAGTAYDLATVSVGSDFLDDVSKALSPGKIALVAEIEEQWTTPVDIGMQAAGGVVFRRTVADVQARIDEERLAAMKADYAQMKAEHARAKADRQASFTEKMNELDSRIQAHLERTKHRREAQTIKEQLKAAMKSTQADQVRAKAS